MSNVYSEKDINEVINVIDGVVQNVNSSESLDEAKDYANELSEAVDILDQYASDLDDILTDLTLYIDDIKLDRKLLKSDYGV